MYKGGRYYDTGTKVFQNEKHPWRNTDRLMPVCECGKRSADARSYQNDKDGRDPGTHVAIVVISRLTGRHDGGA